MKSGKIRILTYHHVANNGAILQAYSLCNSLNRELNDYDVKILDYKSKELRLHELLKVFKLHKEVPFFYFQRHLKFKKFTRANLRLDKKLPINKSLKRLIDFSNSQNYDALIVGSDNIWKIAEKPLLPKFPNIYWLSDKITAKKIAYAVSAYSSDLHLVNKYKDTIRNYLNAFDLIGVRDKFTSDLVKSCNINIDIPVLRVPDPTFLYEIKKTNADEILTNSGIDLDKPILGILTYGKGTFSERIRNYSKSKGYQIIALSMYNPYADLNLGHILDPFEWAEIFKYLTFCITDRFHGTIFCLKNKTPFVSIEPRPINSTRESKIYSLLNDFDILQCYADVYKNDFNVDDFFDKWMGLLKSWEKYKDRIDNGLEEMEEKSSNCIKKIKKVMKNA